jgi:serine/threonine protein kinase
MRKHPNIVDILGLCVEEMNESPALALVLEYSSKGNLKDFLSQAQPSTAIAERCSFILQVAQGLVALHRLRVCHGDMKTENVLVFPKGKGWQVKISDFGQSVFASHGDETESVIHPTGTMLLEAPELRK